MKLAGEILFNLEINAIASFWLGLVVAAALVHLLRLRDKGGGLLLLALPWAKVAFDLARGVPHDSFFWATRLGQRQDLGSFLIGVGTGGPFAAPMFQGKIWALHQGERSPQSLADLLSRALSKHIGEPTGALLGWSIALVSLMFIATRVVQLVRSSAHARRIRAASEPVEKRAVGHRGVDVVVSDGHGGVPFAAGLWRPFIVLPRGMCDALAPDEREAVLRHEIAHVARFDVAWIVASALSSDALWYVPGARWLAGRMRALLEHAADRAAVDSGVRPVALASAIVSVGELAGPPLSSAPPELGLLARGATTGLRRRVERLLAAPDSDARQGATAPKSPWTRAAAWARIAFVLWLVVGVMQSVCCGNHSG